MAKKRKSTKPKRRATKKNTQTIIWLEDLFGITLKKKSKSKSKHKKSSRKSSKHKKRMVLKSTSRSRKISSSKKRRTRYF